jgi:hypothetical protein
LLELTDWRDWDRDSDSACKLSNVITFVNLLPVLSVLLRQECYRLVFFHVSSLLFEDLLA